MKINKLLKILTTLMALGLSSWAIATPVTDVQDYSNNLAGEYFVDNDANKYSSPWYRDKDQDWGWIHDPIAGSGFSSISLEISAFDVDYDPGDEEDYIYAWNSSANGGAGDWFGLGILDGNNDVWAFTSFDLTGYSSWIEAEINSGLKIWMDIDSLDTGRWLVTLGKATLSIDGGSQECVPTPGVPCTSVPEPYTLVLFGLGLTVLGLRRRRRLS